MRYPKQLDSCPAIGLSQLLLGGRIDADTTGRDVANPVRRKSRLVFELRHRYGWPVESVNVAVRAESGRRTWMRCFYLRPDTIALARAAGADHWISSYWTAAAIRRARSTSLTREPEGIAT